MEGKTNDVMGSISRFEKERCKTLKQTMTKSLLASEN